VADGLRDGSDRTYALRGNPVVDGACRLVRDDTRDASGSDDLSRLCRGVRGLRGDTSQRSGTWIDDQAPIGARRGWAPTETRIE
jgi:hypothetical protein